MQAPRPLRKTRNVVSWKNSPARELIIPQKSPCEVPAGDHDMRGDEAIWRYRLLFRAKSHYPRRLRAEAAPRPMDVSAKRLCVRSSQAPERTIFSTPVAMAWRWLFGAAKALKVNSASNGEFQGAGCVASPLRRYQGDRSL